MGNLCGSASSPVCPRYSPSHVSEVCQWKPYQVPHRRKLAFSRTMSQAEIDEFISRITQPTTQKKEQMPLQKS
jgi:hypothetical protein